MYCNEMKNVKARCETLFNVRKTQLIETNDETLSVEQLIRNIKVNKDHLFLDVEQGPGKFTNDVHVVINHMRKKEAISWIVQKHVLVNISDGFEHKTSIRQDIIRTTNATKSQEELRAFLHPALQSPEANKTKRFKHKRKSHAEVTWLENVACNKEKENK